MVRVTENQMARQLLVQIQRNRAAVDTHQTQISTGLKVLDPGDSNFSGTIAQLNGVLERNEGYDRRIKTLQGSLQFQEDILASVTEQMVRAKEVAVQGANEVLSPTERFSLGEEVMQIRDQLVALANSTYQGQYIFGGAVTNTPPFTDQAYVTGNGQTLERYVYTTSPGGQLTQTVQVSDTLTVDVNTPGDQTLQRAIAAVERLGRALQGYDTEPVAVTAGLPDYTVLPDGNGVQYTFPADFSLQTTAIQNAMDLLDQARERDLIPERVNLGSRLRRLDTADELRELSDYSTREVLSDLRDADTVEAATNLQLSQTALEASLAVSSTVFNLNILDFI